MRIAADRGSNVSLLIGSNLAAQQEAVAWREGSNYRLR